MRVAIFGGTGFIGRYLVEALLAASFHPVLFVRKGGENRVERQDKGTLIIGDLRDSEAVRETVRDADAVIYNIGILRELPKRGVTFEALHFEGAKTVIEAAKAVGVSRFLLMSANGIRADGTAYQRTKHKAEQYLKSSGLAWTIFRPSVVFGKPYGRKEFASQLFEDVIKPPLPAPLFYNGLWPSNAGTFAMSPVHVEDVTNAFVTALRRPDTIGKVLPLGGPGAIRWRDIVATIARAVGKAKRTIPVPTFGMAAAAAMLDHSPAFPITRDQLSMLLEGNVCTSIALEGLDISPRPFNTETLAYLSD